ncbi:type II toxin-antitoxin system Phd/YefM family antitoxin [Nocardia cyriacigeorgica]|uniref:type II toxin-antitoxin system Phd/YefM family antitoxin n=1 Tax=Nocardia cyriacigeorgica TaxID=135487 RepID=UPI0024559FEF|nr:type II toxin-antitoxin system prevent-host-death family antitoxin [Nocardia cyriacigeorgica]
MSGSAAEQFNIHDAKTNLSRIIERVEHGEEIIISRAGHPVAKVVPLKRRVDRRGRGSLRGALRLSPRGRPPPPGVGGRPPPAPPHPPRARPFWCPMCCPSAVLPPTSAS